MHLKSSNPLKKMVPKMDEKDEKEDSGKTSVPMTALNVSNCIVGSGIVGIPFALKQAGFGLGLLALLLLAGIADHTLIMLIKAADLSQTTSYQDTMRAAFGAPGYWTIAIMQLLYSIINMVGYCVLIGDNISTIMIRLSGSHTIEELEQNFWGRREFLIAAILLVFDFPLVLYKALGSLSRWSGMSLGAVFFMLSIFVTKIFTFGLGAGSDAFTFAKPEALESIGLFAFAFMCHHASFVMYEGMKSPSLGRWTEVADVSMLLVMLLTVAVGIVGYITFAEFTQGDILENYCATDDIVNMGRLVFTVSLVLTYPVEMLVSRTIAEMTFLKKYLPLPLWAHFFLSLGLVLITYAGSLTTNCLQDVLVFNGLLLATPLAYFWPPCLMLKLQSTPLWSYKNIGHYLIIIFSVFVFFVGTIFAVLGIHRNSHKCGQNEAPFYCLSTGAGNESVTGNNLIEIVTTWTPS